MKINSGENYQDFNFSINLVLTREAWNHFKFSQSLIEITSLKRHSNKSLLKFFIYIYIYLYISFNLLINELIIGVATCSSLKRYAATFL